MKKFAVFFLSLLSLSLMFLPACSSELSASLGQSVTLRPGQSVYIKGEDLKIEFIRVTGDSRCPTGAT